MRKQFKYLGFNDMGKTTTSKQEQCSIGVVTNRTYKCLGCKHYGIKVVNDKK